MRRLKFTAAPKGLPVRLKTGLPDKREKVVGEPGFMLIR